MKTKDKVVCKSNSETDMDAYVDALSRVSKGDNVGNVSNDELIELYAESIDHLTEANFAVNMWSNRAFNGLRKSRTAMRSSRNTATKLDLLGDMLTANAGLVLISIAVSGTDKGGGLTGLTKIWNIIKGGRRKR